MNEEFENFNQITADEGRAIIERLSSSEFFRQAIEENTVGLKLTLEEMMAKKDEIELQPDDAKVEAVADTKKSPSKSDLQARVDELEAKIERAKKAFPKNGHIQRILRD